VQEETEVGLRIDLVLQQVGVIESSQDVIAHISTPSASHIVREERIAKRTAKLVADRSDRVVAHVHVELSAWQDEWHKDVELNELIVGQVELTQAGKASRAVQTNEQRRLQVRNLVVGQVENLQALWKDVVKVAVQHGRVDQVVRNVELDHLRQTRQLFVPIGHVGDAVERQVQEVNVGKCAQLLNGQLGVQVGRQVELVVLGLSRTAVHRNYGIQVGARCAFVAKDDAVHGRLRYFHLVYCALVLRSHQTDAAKQLAEQNKE
jgi:hypothetical protein